MKNTALSLLVLLLTLACSPKYQDVILAKAGDYKTQPAYQHNYLNPAMIRAIVLQEPLISFSGEYQGGNPFKQSSYRRTDQPQPKANNGNQSDEAALDSLTIQKMILSVAGFRSLKLENDEDQAFFAKMQAAIEMDSAYNLLGFVRSELGQTHFFVKVQEFKLKEIVMLSTKANKTSVFTLLGGDVRLDDLEREKDKLLLVQMANRLGKK